MLPILHSFPSSQRAAFTLTEVLVTCMIIAVLATLIFLQWDTYRKKANQSVCAGNLKQLGVAFFLYATEHNGQLPSSVDPAEEDPMTDNPLGKGLQWDMQIFNYLYPEGFAAFSGTNRSTVFWCPSSQAVLPGKRGNSLSYRYNLEIARNTKNSRNLATQENRYQLVILTDSAIRSEESNRSSGLGGGTNNTLFLKWSSSQVNFAYDWHQGVVNILFADGHVAPRRPVGNPEDADFASDYRKRLPRDVIFYNGQTPTPN